MTNPDSLKVAQVVLLGEIDTRMLAGALRQLAGEVVEVKEYDPSEYGGIRTAIRVANPDGPGAHDLLVRDDPSRRCPYDGPRTSVDAVYEVGEDAERGIAKLAALASAFGGFLCRDIHAPEWEAVQPDNDEFSLTLQEHTWLGLVETVGMDAAARIVKLESWQIDDLKDLLSRYRKGMDAEATASMTA